MQVRRTCTEIRKSTTLREGGPGDLLGHGGEWVSGQRQSVSILHLQLARLAWRPSSVNRPDRLCVSSNTSWTSALWLSARCMAGYASFSSNEQCASSCIDGRCGG